MSVLVSLSLAGLSAKGALVQGTDPTFGPNSLTIDTSTDLAWLNLNYSLGLSYDQVLADTAPGGLFSGYRFATASEVLGLYDSAGIPDNGNGYYPLGTPSILSLISLVGPMAPYQGEPSIYGLTGTTTSQGLQASAAIYASGLNSTLEFLVTSGPGIYDFAYNPSLSSAGIGSWLVKEVPEPSVGVIAIGGLLVLTRLKRPRR